MASFFASAAALFLVTSLYSDTIYFKDNQEAKGLIVERHHDRLILSTEAGEVPILLSEIEKIDYQNPALGFYEMGKQFEKQDKLGNAMAYYQKASELDPSLKEASIAMQSVRSKFWARSLAGPVKMIQTKQALADAWENGVSSAVTEDQQKKSTHDEVERMGLKLKADQDWVVAHRVQKNSPASTSGIRSADRLITLNGESLRYLPVEAVESLMCQMGLVAQPLEIERRIRLETADRRTKWGFQMDLQEVGLVVTWIDEKQIAYQKGLRVGDVIEKIENQSTRYMPLMKARELLQKKSGEINLFIRRKLLMTRS